jgi:hypothetical protein
MCCCLAHRVFMCMNSHSLVSVPRAVLVDHVKEASNDMLSNSASVSKLPHSSTITCISTFDYF